MLIVAQCYNDSMTTSFPIEAIEPFEAFPMLTEIPQPPKRLFMRGSLDRMRNTVYLTVVGSRNHTSYGKGVCQSLIAGLQGYPITIVSGLALGIDAVAHRAALAAGLPTIAFPGSGLGWNVLYPATHRGLAEEILSAGGALISEYTEDTRSALWTFPQRNRLEAGISHMTLIIEAEEKSGTLITARLATEYNKIVGAIPGPITSPSSAGANWLLTLGAVPITSSADILRELGLEARPTEELREYLMLNDEEEKILRFLTEPKTKEVIIRELELDPIQAIITFSTLEIKGAIRETLGTLERVL